MSNFYFSPVYSFVPYMYGQFYQNPCQIGYGSIQQDATYFLPLNQPQNIQSGFGPQFNSLKEQQEHVQGSLQDGSEIEQKKVKIKKRRGVDKQKELESAKKNSQSNIINQFFSFFSCRSQSEQIVEKAIMVSVRQIEELQKVISIFYNIMKCMSLQRIKKYVNKKTLLNIFGKENIEKQIPQILQKFKTLTYITIDEISEIIRRCCFYFLRNISLVSILASKRISALSKREHLKKRRQLGSIVSGKL